MRGTLPCWLLLAAVPLLPSHVLSCALVTPGARMGLEVLPDVSDRCTSAWKVPVKGGGVRQQH